MEKNTRELAGSTAKTRGQAALGSRDISRIRLTMLARHNANSMKSVCQPILFTRSMVVRLVAV